MATSRGPHGKGWHFTIAKGRFSIQRHRKAAACKAVGELQFQVFARLVGLLFSFIWFSSLFSMEFCEHGQG